GLCWRRVVFLRVTDVGEELGAVSDADGQRLLLAVAEDAELHDGSDLAGGDIGYELVAILDGLAIDGDDDVAGLDATLGSGTIGSDGVDEHPALGKAVDAADRCGFSALERDADGAPDDLVLRADEHVVDVRDDV